MKNLTILFSRLFLLPLFLATVSCSKNYSWDDYMQAYSQAQEHKQYKEAEKQLLLAIESAKNSGNQDSRLIMSLYALADFYAGQRRYAEAEPLYLRVLTIAEKKLGPNHPDTWLYLNALGEIYEQEGKEDRAEQFYKRANAVAEKGLGNGYSDMPKSLQPPGFLPVPSSHDLPPQSLHNLVSLYTRQNKYSQAEMLYEHWANILEKQFGPSNAGLEMCLSNLSELYRDEGKDALADKYKARVDAVSSSRKNQDSKKLNLAPSQDH